MKFKIILLLLIAISVFLLLKFNNEKTKLSVNLTKTNPSPKVFSPQIKAKDIDIEFNSKKMAVSIIRVTDVKKITLIPNFTDKNSALNILTKNKCNSLTSGGFYSKENYPLGLFIINSKVISKEIQSLLFNGFFFVDVNENVGIRREIPDNNFRFAIQSGPILMENGESLSFKINNDEEARRIAVAINREGNIFFIAVYNRESNLQGPLLSELPEFVKIAGEKINENFEIALNLDGGSASAFYSENISLSELSAVGSSFCIK